jgi:hypothetical protein
MKKGFLTALGLILIILACGPEWEAWETQEAMANNKKTDIYGYPIPAPQDSVPVPEGLPPNALKLESAPGELNPVEYFSGKPIVPIHENKYREVTSHGIQVPRVRSTLDLGFNDEIIAQYFVNDVPDENAFKIIEIREYLAIDPATANVTNIILEYFILQDKKPIYYGFNEVASVPNNGIAAVNTLYYVHNSSHPIDIYIPQDSAIGIITRFNATASIGDVASYEYRVRLQGYLMTPPYPLGKGKNERFTSSPTVLEWANLFNTFQTF